MQKQYKIKVDITKKYAMPAFEVNTNDLKSIRLSIEVLNGASPLDLKDKTVRIAIRKPDNHIVFQDCTVTDATNGQVEVILENQAYITPGTHTAEIMCYKGNDVVAVSGTFSYKSSKGIMNDDAVESKSEFTAINRTIEEAERILEDLRENGGGVGVDEQARQGIQDVTAQLAEKAPQTSNTFILFGDSITGQNGKGDYQPSSGINAYWFDGGGYFSWANVMLGHRMKVLANKGIGGNTTEQMLNRIDADVINFNPKPSWCVVFGGTNDLPTKTYEHITTNLKNMYAKLRQAGIRIVACTILPRNHSGDTVIAKQLIHKVNKWIKEYCISNPNILLCDWHSAIVDPATGNAKAEFLTDQVHPNHKGAARMGKIMADTLKPHIPYVDMLLNSNGDTDNLIQNGMLIGNSNGLASPGWAIYGTPTYTASKVLRTDGIQGEWQQITVTTSDGSNLKLQAQNTNAGTDWQVGDKVYAQVEFETDNDWAGDNHAFYLQMDFFGNGGTSSDLTQRGNDTKPAFRIDKGVFRTPIATVPENTTRLQLNVVFQGKGTIRVARAEIKKV